MSQQPMAYLYQEFLESAEARPIRILAEYLEPLRRFKAQKIQDTVVFFGSARVDSRERAERALRTLRARGVRGADEHYQTELTKSRQALEWAKRCPNLLLETSATPDLRTLRRALDELGPSRFLFGSDGPGCVPHLELHKLRLRLRGHEASAADLLQGNLRRLLPSQGKA